jgi:endo-1,4-beta-xylanase
MWRTKEGAYLIREDGSERPALEWLRHYLSTDTADTATR